MTDYVANLALTLGNANADMALIRAAKLGILPTCGRCLGSGHYSHNGTHSRCYACNGSGARRPKDAAEWAVVCERAEGVKEDGTLATYLRACEARNTLKGAAKTVMAAWKLADFGSHYSWMKAAAYSRDPSDENKRHRDIADINKKCADAFDMVQAIHLDSKAASYDADCLAAAAKLEWALAIVEAARCELKTYLLANPA